MRLPIDAELQGSTSNAEVAHDGDIEQTVAALLKSREIAFEKAKENISKAQQAQKETYDRKHVQSELPLGTKVWLENTAQKQRKGGKMDPIWLGPYSINRSLGKGLYELKNQKGEILKKKANITRLKQFISRSPEQEPTAEESNSSSSEKPGDENNPSSSEKPGDENNPSSSEKDKVKRSRQNVVGSQGVKK